MYVKNANNRHEFIKQRTVSILVLLDVCKELVAEIAELKNANVFQSLFYWMYVKNKSLRKIGLEA